MKNLNPCPDCGYAWPVLDHMLQQEKGTYRQQDFYYCPRCGTMSEPRRRITLAAEEWNAGHMAAEKYKRFAPKKGAPDEYEYVEREKRTIEQVIRRGY